MWLSTFESEPPRTGHHFGDQLTLEDIGSGGADGVGAQFLGRCFRMVPMELPSAHYLGRVFGLGQEVGAPERAAGSTEATSRVPLHTNLVFSGDFDGSYVVWDPYWVLFLEEIAP